MQRCSGQTAFRGPLSRSDAGFDRTAATSSGPQIRGSLELHVPEMRLVTEKIVTKHRKYKETFKDLHTAWLSVRSCAKKKACKQFRSQLIRYALSFCLTASSHAWVPGGPTLGEQVPDAKGTQETKNAWLFRSLTSQPITVPVASLRIAKAEYDVCQTL